MTILIVSGDFTSWGGMDRANYELAWYLADHVGAKIELVAHEVAEPLANHRNVTWQRVPRPLNSSNLGSLLLARCGVAAGRAIQGRGGRVIVNGGNCPWPDINWVHAVHHSWQRRVAHAPVHVRARQWLSRKVDLRAEEQALRMARIIVANSEKTRTTLIEDLGLPSDQVHTICFGTDPRTFHPATQEQKVAIRRWMGWPERRLTAVFVGTLGYDRNKGFDVLFEAWKQLCADRSWDVDLVVLGAGAEVLHWENQAAMAGLSQRILMIGFRRDIAAILQAADVLVHPAFYEAYGLSVHEALCCGIPALVNRTAGVAERYPSSLQDLLLDHPPSAMDLADRLWRWRRGHPVYHDRMQKLSAKLRQRTWADMAEEFVHLAMPSMLDLPRSSHRSHTTFPGTEQPKPPLPAAVVNRMNPTL